VKFILREKLMALGLKLQNVTRTYQRNSHRFATDYLQWLEDAEKELGSLRDPMVVYLQGEKSKLMAAADGYQPDYVRSDVSARKRRNAIIANSLDNVADMIMTRISSLDQEFEQLFEKMAHAVAVLASKNTMQFLDVAHKKTGMSDIWNALGALPEIAPMYNYFSVKLNRSDREYLLSHALDHVISNTSVTMESHNRKGLYELSGLEEKLNAILSLMSRLNVESFSDILDAASNKTSRRTLAKSAGVELSELIILVKCADLMRVEGVNLAMAYVLVVSGVDSVPELASRNPERLLITIGEAISTNQFDNEPPSLDEVERWVVIAQALPKRVNY